MALTKLYFTFFYVPMCLKTKKRNLAKNSFHAIYQKTKPSFHSFAACNGIFVFAEY
jgi:MFS-type transporter involved in bile tolerance (Atg22 family)